MASRKRTSQLEKHIQSAIEQMLDLLENMGQLVYQKNNTGAVRIDRPGAKSSFMRFGKRGSPDFLVWRKAKVNAFDPRGSPVKVLETIFLEVKTDVGRMSDGQKEFREKIEKLGGRYVIVHSFEEAKKILYEKS